MSPVRYSAKELLSLRHASPNKEISYKLAARVDEDYDLGKFCPSLMALFVSNP